MNELIVDLNISPEEYQRMYRGEVSKVLARTLDGRRVQFPADILRSVVSRTGIKGRFSIQYDAQGRFSKIIRLR